MQFAPVVEQISAHIGGIERGYEVWNLEFHAPLVTAETQEAKVSDALRCVPELTKESQRRLHAGLVYFHRAARLSDAGSTRWEFLAETVLNLAKSLEALFAPNSQAQNRDPVRAGLAALDLSRSVIETWFIPALLLRNQLDVAHVRLSLLDRGQTIVLARYAEGAIEHFRALFQQLTALASKGESPIEQYVDEGDASTSRMLSRIDKQIQEFRPATA
ncbi:hypothetical protein [Gemmatimonas sp.]|uniref:hypothetical protein n=1 Tax=Gemmatimonas sp. TaxID=1962908 RepID=UPI003DA3FE3C